MLCWSKSLGSKDRNVSTRRHNNDSMELLKIKTATKPLRAPHASQLTGEEGGFCYCADWGDWSWLLRRNWAAVSQWSSRRVCLEYMRSLGVSKYYYALWPSQWRISTTQLRQDYQWLRPCSNEDWVTLPGKQAWPADMFAEHKWNTEGIVEIGSYKYQVNYMTSYRNEDCNCY